MQTRKKRKCLRIDNDSEFFSNDFNRFCKDYDISRQKITLYSLQKNGSVERMNRTLMEKAKSTLSGVGLEIWFWAKAISNAFYPVNRSRTSNDHYRRY